MNISTTFLSLWTAIYQTSRPKISLIVRCAHIACYRQFNLIPSRIDIIVQIWSPDFPLSMKDSLKDYWKSIFCRYPKKEKTKTSSRVHIRKVHLCDKNTGSNIIGSLFVILSIAHIRFWVPLFVCLRPLYTRGRMAMNGRISGQIH